MTNMTAVDREPNEPRAARLVDVGAARSMAVAAARRVIARDGARQVTLDGVAHEAGLPTGALVSHFDNEQELLMAVAADDLAALAKNMRAEPAAGGSQELMQRVEVLQDAFSTILDRHQKALHERNDMASWVEQCVKNLQQRVEMPEHREAPMLADVKDALSPEPHAVAADDLPLPAHVAHLLTEPPPMPDLSASELPPVETGSSDLPPILPAQTGNVPSNIQEAVLMDNYLLDARRAAIATQAGNDRERKEAKRRTKRTRVVAVAFLGPIAILATAAMVLNRNVVTAMSTPPAPEAPQVADVPQVPEPVQAPLPPPQVVVATPANPAPPQVAATEPLDRLSELAASGDVKAERDLGLKYLAGDGVGVNESEAARWLMRAAYRGEPTAEYWLGTLYARGQGVPEDAFQANHWYEAAAKKGNRRAMHSYAVAYFQGWGVEKNYAEAARWFRSAADLGFVDSQFNLAVLYERGAGLQQSLSEAYKWYAIAAKEGDKEAEARVAALATQLAPADLALAQQAAASFKPTEMDNEANIATGPIPTSG